MIKLKIFLRSYSIRREGRRKRVYTFFSAEFFRITFRTPQPRPRTGLSHSDPTGLLKPRPERRILTYLVIYYSAALTRAYQCGAAPRIFMRGRNEINRVRFHVRSRFRASLDLRFRSVSRSASTDMTLLNRAKPLDTGTRVIKTEINCRDITVTAGN